MRDYGKVHSSFWSSATIGGLSEDARLLALYLMTCSHNTITGTFRLPDGYAIEDLGWVPERVSKGFEELYANGFANRCETTKWVLICKHLDWNLPDNPNQRKAANKIAQTIPDACSWKVDFIGVWGDYLLNGGPKNGSGSETLSKPFSNQKQEQKQEQQQEGVQSNEPTDDEKKNGRTFKRWLESLPDGQDAIPASDPVFDYAIKAGIPYDFLDLSWAEFSRRMMDNQKRYKSWPKAYRNYVENNYFELWRITPAGEYVLTMKGQQAKKVNS